MLKYIFNSYSEKELEQIRMGTNPMLPPHLMLEVFYTPALAHPMDAGWAVQQMGTRRTMDFGFKTQEDAVNRAVEIAKQMIPNGVVFIRESAGGRP